MEPILACVIMTIFLYQLSDTWKLEITKQDGTATHQVTLKNIERIDYEPEDGSFRQPVIPDLATETKSSIDLEKLTAYKVRRGTMYWEPRFNDCYKEEKEREERRKKKQTDLVSERID